MDWSEERVATLTNLWREGYSASQVARRLGDVSRSAVIGKVHRLGLAGRGAPSQLSPSSVRPSTRARATPGGVRQIGAPVARRTPTRGAVVIAWNVAPTATIATLAEHGCRWPIGDPGEPDFGFCGRSKAGRGAYCAGHAPMSLRRREGTANDGEIDQILRQCADDGGGAPPLDHRWAEPAAFLKDLRA